MAPKRKRVIKECKICNKKVEIKICRGKTFKYCSRKCFGIANSGENNYIHRRPDIVKLRSILQKGKPRPYQEGEKNGNWKGGITKMKSGYFLVKIGASKRDYAHRVVMEKHLQRKLLSHEIVHHLNGNKQDNRIENLNIMTNGEHIKLHSKQNSNGRLRQHG